MPRMLTSLHGNLAPYVSGKFKSTHANLFPEIFFAFGYICHIIIIVFKIFKISFSGAADTGRGAIIGKALESMEGKGTINMLVMMG